MPREMVITKPFIAQFMTWIFVFSTIYTLAFYFYQGAAQTQDFNGISDDANDYKTVGIFGITDQILEFISWISPFALIKGLLFIVMRGTPEIYEFLNLIMLRPMSWIVAVVTVNYIKTLLPTWSGE
jgi:hypothetical protein